MDTFKITSGNHFIFVDQIPEDFDRNDYTVYGNGENYYIFKDRSVNLINFNMFKTFFDNHLITNTIIKNTSTSAIYNLFITDEKLDRDYIIANNQLFYFRPYIYEAGDCIYKDKNYYYFITDTIITYKFYPLKSIFLMKYILDMLSYYNNIGCVCNDMKYSDFVSCTFGNGHKYEFICLSEFIMDKYKRTRNILDSMYTELDNMVTPSDNLITLMLLFMQYNGLYNCNCKHVNFYDQTSIFIINGKYYLRDKAAKMFKINQGFSTPYDLLHSSYIDKFKVLGSATNIPPLFQNRDFMNFMKEHPDYFDSYNLFNENAKKIGFYIKPEIYDTITNLYSPYSLFKNTYEDFKNMMKYQNVRKIITREIFDKIKNNPSLFDNWSNFNKIAPQFLKNYIKNDEIFEDIYKTLIKYDIEVIDMIISNGNHKYRNKYNNDSYDTYAFKLIDEYKFLDCINFKNNFIKTIICIFSKIEEITNITSYDIINNFDNYAEQFNNILVSEKLGNEYFSYFAIAIIYAIYTRKENRTPNYQFMNNFIMKIKDLVDNNVPHNPKIVNEMIKEWCINGKMIRIATCNEKTQKFYQEFLYGDKNIDNKYRKIDFDKFIDNKDYKFNNTTSFNVYDYEYEED